MNMHFFYIPPSDIKFRGDSYETYVMGQHGFLVKDREVPEFCEKNEIKIVHIESRYDINKSDDGLRLSALKLVTYEKIISVRRTASITITEPESSYPDIELLDLTSEEVHHDVARNSNYKSYEKNIKTLYEAIKKSINEFVVPHVDKKCCIVLAPYGKPRGTSIYNSPDYFAFTPTLEQLEQKFYIVFGQPKISSYMRPNLREDVHLSPGTHLLIGNSPIVHGAILDSISLYNPDDQIKCMFINVDPTHTFKCLTDNLKQFVDFIKNPDMGIANLTKTYNRNISSKTESLEYIISRHLSNIEANKQSIENLKTRIQAEQASIEATKATISIAKNSKDKDYAKELAEQMEFLNTRVDKITRARFNGNFLEITTKALCFVNPSSGKVHKAGSYLITLNLKDLNPLAPDVNQQLVNRLRFYNLDLVGTTSFPDRQGTHVFGNGVACLGNFTAAATPLVNRLDFKNLALLCIGFLESVNPADSQGAGSIRHYPVISKKDLSEEYQAQSKELVALEG